MLWIQSMCSESFSIINNCSNAWLFSDLMKFTAVNESLSKINLMFSFRDKAIGLIEVWEVFLILMGFWLCQCFCCWWIFNTNVKCFFCSMVLGVTVSVYYCEIFKFCFGVLWRCGGFWWQWWFDFYGLKLFLSMTCWFYICIQLCSCGFGISRGRLCHFS